MRSCFKHKLCIHICNHIDIHVHAHRQTYEHVLLNMLGWFTKIICVSIGQVMLCRMLMHSEIMLHLGDLDLHHSRILLS